MSDNPVTQEVETFNKDKLKKTITQEKNIIPTQKGRCAEKCGPNKLTISSAFHPGYVFLSSLLCVVQHFPACQGERQLQTLHCWLTAGSQPPENSSFLCLMPTCSEKKKHVLPLNHEKLHS